jgi:hypothetical protein
LTSFASLSRYILSILSQNNTEGLLTSFLLLLAINTIAGIRIEAFSNRRKHLKKNALSLNGFYRSNDIYVTGKFPEIFDPSAFIIEMKETVRKTSV